MNATLRIFNKTFPDEVLAEERITADRLTVEQRLGALYNEHAAHTDRYQATATEEGSNKPFATIN